MKNEGKYSIILGFMILLFLVVVGISVAFGLGYIQINKNQNTDVIGNNTSKEDLTQNTENVVSELEKGSIEEYIQKIYRRHEYSIPEFENINNADSKWLWGIIFDNCKNNNTLIGNDRPNTASMNQMLATGKELFGETLTVKPSQTDNINFFEYDSNNEVFVEIGRGGSTLTPKYVISEIKKDGNEFTVNIIQYIYYEPFVLDSDEAYDLSLKNNEETVITFSSSEKIDDANYVLNNKDKFTQKELVIKINSGKCNLISSKIVK